MPPPLTDVERNLRLLRELGEEQILLESLEKHINLVEEARKIGEESTPEELPTLAHFVEMYNFIKYTVDVGACPDGCPLLAEADRRAPTVDGYHLRAGEEVVTPEPIDFTVDYTIVQTASGVKGFVRTDNLIPAAGRKRKGGPAIGTSIEYRKAKKGRWMEGVVVHGGLKLKGIEHIISLEPLVGRIRHSRSLPFTYKASVEVLRSDGTYSLGTVTSITPDAVQVTLQTKPPMTKTLPYPKLHTHLRYLSPPATPYLLPNTPVTLKRSHTSKRSSGVITTIDKSGYTVRLKDTTKVLSFYKARGVLRQVDSDDDDSDAGSEEDEEPTACSLTDV